MHKGMSVVVESSVYAAQGLQGWGVLGIAWQIEIESLWEDPHATTPLDSKLLALKRSYLRLMLSLEGAPRIWACASPLADYLWAQKYVQ